MNSKKIKYYDCIECNAIAVTACDTEPQNSVLLIDRRFNCDNKSVAFGAYLEFISDIDDIANLDVSTASIDISTVTIDGISINDLSI